jgi:hypothetical protein
MNLPQIRVLAKSPKVKKMLVHRTGMTVSLNAKILDQPDRGF